MATARAGDFLRRLTRGMAAESMSAEPDRRLVERLLAGPDEVAFEAVVRRHGPMVYRVCWRALQRDEDAEDAFQATFLLLARKLGSLRKRDSLASWLHGVAHRVALDAKKQLARRRRHEAAPKDDPTGPRDGPPEEITWRELRAVLDAELAVLPERHRQPLVLCYLEGRSQEEAAGQLGWSKSTLLRRLEEARVALGRRLAHKGHIWSASIAGVLISDCLSPAALPSKLVDATVDAGARALVGRTTAGLVSARVTALAEGMVKAMYIRRLACVIPAVVLAGALLPGAWVMIAAQTPKDPPKPTAGPAPRAPAAKDGAGPVELKPVVIREKAAGVSRLAWSPNGKVLATIVSAEDVVDNTLADGTPVKGPDGKPLRVIATRSTVKFWDAQTGKLLKSLEEDKRARGEAIAFSPDGKHVAVALMRLPGGGDEKEKGDPGGRVVRILDADKWTVRQQVTTDDDDIPFGGLDSLVFSPDGKMLAISGTSPRAETGSWVRLWDVAEGKMKGGTKFAAAAATRPKDTKEGKSVVATREHAIAAGLAFVPDSELVAIGEYDPDTGRATIWCYDANTGRRMEKVDFGKASKNLPFRLIGFAAAGEVVVLKDGAASLFDARTGKVQKTLDGKGPVLNAALSPTGRHVAASSFRNPESKERVAEVILWDTKTGESKAVASEQGRLMTASALPFSPDGKWLAISVTHQGFWDENFQPKPGGEASGELRLLPVR
jgi:RNA polymerase sigma factor (sigma-70 family)